MLRAMDNTITINIGLRIRALRKERGWSQDELAEAAGINQKYVSEIERGRVNASITMYHAIAQGLDMSLSELTDGLQAWTRDHELLEVFRRAEKLDEKGRRVVVEALRGILRGMEPLT